MTDQSPVSVERLTKILEWFTGTFIGTHDAGRYAEYWFMLDERDDIANALRELLHLRSEREQKKCDQCHGKGQLELYNPGSMWTCDACSGTGRATRCENAAAWTDSNGDNIWLDRVKHEEAGRAPAQQTAAKGGEAELTPSNREIIETLRDIEAYFRGEAAYECENMGHGGSTIALGRWKRYFMTLANVVQDLPELIAHDKALAQRDAEVERLRKGLEHIEIELRRMVSNRHDVSLYMIRELHESALTPLSERK